MHTFSTTFYGIADRFNYNDRREDFKCLTEALHEVIKTRNPKNYIVTKSEFSRVFDDSDVFQRETHQTTKVDCSVWEVRKCDEIGHDYDEGIFATITEAFEYMNSCERWDRGWHYYHVEIKL